MQSLTTLLETGTDLTPAQVEKAVSHLISTEVPDGEKMSFLTALRAKGETAVEVAAFAKNLLKHSTPLPLDGSITAPIIDVCGTGGDRQGFFNISTAVMFVAAAGGAVVAKHGNRAATSKTGAADVLEELGVALDATPEQVAAQLTEHGVSFLFAPVYHPALKTVAPLRKALAAQGKSTVFNLLGPLLNPTRPTHQLVGIYSEQLLPIYASALQSLGRKRAWAVHGDGTDELTLTGPTLVHNTEPDRVSHFVIEPESLGLTRCTAADLKGGERVENAKILLGVLDGSIQGPKRDVVLLNAAAAFVVSGLSEDLPAGLDRAREALDSGTALKKLNAIRKK